MSNYNLMLNAYLLVVASFSQGAYIIQGIEFITRDDITCRCTCNLLHDITVFFVEKTLTIEAIRFEQLTVTFGI